jgi:hypothetical protein
LDNIPLKNLDENNAKNVDVSYIRYFGDNGYSKNYNNSYARPPYAQNNFGNRPYIPFHNANDSQNKWKLATTSLSNDYLDKQQEINKNLIEQVSSHTTMIKELNETISTISSDIKVLQHQAI